MKKRIFCILSLMLCLVFCISAAACGKQDNGDTTDKHQAKSEWQWNEAEHWHDCATEGHTDKLEGAAHAFDAGVITVEATETATGEKAFTCTVCGYKKKEVLPALGHKHSFGTEWKTSDLNHWHECACGEKSEEEAHKFGEWNVIKPATETETGSKERLCSVCGYKETAEIPMEAHTHKFATEWTYDETNHWHASTCGHEVKEAEAAHNFNDGVITKEPTETAEGVKTYTCTVCGGTKTESVEKLPHTHTFDMANWEKNDTYHWHKATCEHTEEVKDKVAHTWNDGVITKPATETAEGVKTYTCTVCGGTKTESVEKLPHTHTFDMANWEKNDTYHWHKATCEHTEEVKDKAAHTWNDGVITKPATETAEGEKTYTCGVCGYKKIEKIAKLPHTHKFDETKWTYDETNHWHASTCGHEVKEAEAAHNFNDGVITKEPTETAEGVKTFTCTVCGATKTESVPKLTHTHAFDMANWENDDTHHWHKATCGHSDEKNGYEEHKGAWTEKTPAGYGVNKVEERTCTVCKKHQERTVENSALLAKANTVTLKSGVAKTKTYDGTEIALSASDFNTNGNGAITLAYKVKGADGEFSADAPKNAGTYQVKVSVAATAEWKACNITVEYTINKKVLVFETSALTKTYDGTAKYTHNFTVEEGLVEGDVCSYSFDVHQRTTGATSEPCINAGTYGYVISQNEVCSNDNYSVSDMTGLDSGEGTSLTVNKATISGLEISIRESELNKTASSDFIDYMVKIAGKNITVTITYAVRDLMEGGDLLISHSETKRGYCQIEFDDERDGANFQFDANVVGKLILIYDVIV